MPEKNSDLKKVFVSTIQLRGFKSISDLAFDLQTGLNILIGKNGSGKTNILDFLSRTINMSGNNKFFSSYAKIEFVTADNHSIVKELEKNIFFKSENEDLEDQIKVFEKLKIDDQLVYDNLNEERSSRFTFKNRIINYVGSLRSMFIRLGYRPLYSLFIKYNLPKELDVVDTPGIIKANLTEHFIDWDLPYSMGFIDTALNNLGNFYEDSAVKLFKTNTAEVLELLNISYEVITNLRTYSAIESIRFSDNINLYKDEKSILIENVRLEFKVNGKWLPWSQLSDGTKRLFYIISEVTYSKGLILIEEPELGIHPHQFNLLMNFLKEQSENKQIIISTHSPKALDHLKPDELNNILITYYDQEKNTQVRHLTEKEEKKARRYMDEVGFLSDYWMYSDLEE